MERGQGHSSHDATPETKEEKSQSQRAKSNPRHQGQTSATRHSGTPLSSLGQQQVQQSFFGIPQQQQIPAELRQQNVQQQWNIPSMSHFHDSSSMLRIAQSQESHNENQSRQTFDQSSTLPSMNLNIPRQPSFFQSSLPALQGYNQSQSQQTFGQAQTPLDNALGRSRIMQRFTSDDPSAFMDNEYVLAMQQYQHQQASQSSQPSSHYYDRTRLPSIPNFPDDPYQSSFAPYQHQTFQQQPSGYNSSQSQSQLFDQTRSHPVSRHHLINFGSSVSGFQYNVPEQAGQSEQESHLSNEIEEEASELGQGPNSKKGSVISPEDRRPPSTQELEFYEHQVRILVGLMSFNMQHLAFFDQNLWLEAFRAAVDRDVPFNENEVSQLQVLGNNLNYLEEMLISPEEEMDPFLTVTLGDDEIHEIEPESGPSLFESDSHTDVAIGSKRPRKSSASSVSLPLVGHPLAVRPRSEAVRSTDLGNEHQRRLTTLKLFARQPSKFGSNQTRQRTVGSSLNLALIKVKRFEEVFYPNLSNELQSQISALTPFQKNLARNKVREVLAFFKLMLHKRDDPKISTAQLLENNSTFVVRTILNWGREYADNGGRFNKSKIGKHKRVTLFSDPHFRAALKQFAENKGEGISVDGTMHFIQDYYTVHSRNRGDSFPSPPSSRATVHRWLKLSDIKLGPRGKKKGSTNKRGKGKNPPTPSSSSNR